MKPFKTPEEYNKAMEVMLDLMNEGESNLRKMESRKLRALALAAQAYEKNIYTIPAPKSLEGLIELKMYEQNSGKKI